MGSFDKRAYSRRLVERFTVEMTERMAGALPPSERGHVGALANAALAASIDALETAPAATGHTLPVARLTAAALIARGDTGLSPATLYRAAAKGRCYSVTPGARSIGKEFPAWQFGAPVPELIAPVLACLAGQPGSEVHAFWVSAADELNELTPAELLAGRPFETRAALHPSQQALLELPSGARQKKVIEFAQQQSRAQADVIA